MQIPKETLAVISTAHIPPQTAGVMNRRIADGDVVGMSRAEGWLLPVDQDAVGHPELSQLLNTMKAHDVEWLMLDCDADRVDGLPVWDWDIPEPRRIVVKTLPSPNDPSVLLHESALTLVDAYRRAEENDGGSVQWSDIDAAHRLATLGLEGNGDVLPRICDTH